MMYRSYPVFSPRPSLKTGEPLSRRVSDVVTKVNEMDSHWRHLYAMADCPTPEKLAEWESGIPSQGCGCTQGYFTFKAERAPDFSSADSFKDWCFWLHNKVNEKLRRPQYDRDTAEALWFSKRLNTGRSRLLITVATGVEYRRMLNLTGPLMQSYANKNDADFIALTNKTKSKWQLEKFRVFEFAKQYEKTVFVDCDCIIKDSCESLFDLGDGVFIHDDWEFLVDSKWINSERKLVADAVGLVEYDDGSTCLNSGVVVCDKQSACVWSPPETLPDTHCSEQIFVEWSAKKAGYNSLPSRFNWQSYFSGFRDGIKNADLIHFATSRDKLKDISECIEQLKTG